MPEHPDPEVVMAWIDGEAGSAAPEIERHVGDCAVCRALAAELRGVNAQLNSWTVPDATFNMPMPRRGWASPWRWIAMAATLLLGFFAWSWFGAAPAPPAAPAQTTPAVLIEVFIDWQCPVCAHLEYMPVVDSYATSNPGKVSYVFKDFPLNNKCNSQIATAPHAAACEGAVAVRLARDRGKEREMINWLFMSQKGLTAEAVKSQVRSALGVTDFEAAYAQKLPEIAKDVADAGQRQVKFTPSVFVNGMSVNQADGSAPSPVQLDRMIHELLAMRR